jgi:hypothetical protein
VPSHTFSPLLPPDLSRSSSRASTGRTSTSLAWPQLPPQFHPTQSHFDLIRRLLLSRTRCSTHSTTTLSSMSSRILLQALLLPYSTMTGILRPPTCFPNLARDLHLPSRNRALRVLTYWVATNTLLETYATKHVRIDQLTTAADLPTFLSSTCSQILHCKLLSTLSSPNWAWHACPGETSAPSIVFSHSRCAIWLRDTGMH